MKQKRIKPLSKNQKLLKKATENRPTPQQERKALNKLSLKDPDKYFKRKQEQIYKDITKSKKSTNSAKSTKSTKSKSTKSKSKKK